MSGPDDQDDATLVRRVRRGEREAFGILVRRHLRAAHAVARATVRNPADADDVVQEAFLEALVQLERCRDPARFAAWLMTIVRNRGHNRRRYERRREAEPLDVDDLAVAADDPARAVERDELRERLLEALDQLPESQRQAVLLHDLEGRSHAEVAAALGVSDGFSRVLVHRARRHLRGILGAGSQLKEDP